MTEHFFKKCIDSKKINVLGYNNSSEQMTILDSPEHFRKKARENPKIVEVFNNRFTDYPTEKIQETFEKVLEKERKKGLMVKMIPNPGGENMITVEFRIDNNIANPGNITEEEFNEIRNYIGHWFEIRKAPYSSSMMVSLSNRGPYTLTPKQRENYIEIVKRLRKDALEHALKKIE